MSMAEVVRVCGLSRQVIWRRRNAGTFPEPCKLGTQRPIRFLRSEIDAWMKAQLAERDVAVAARRKAMT